MTTKLKIALVALAMAAAPPAFAQQEVLVIGAWRMTSLEIANPDGSMAEGALSAR